MSKNAIAAAEAVNLGANSEDWEQRMKRNVEIREEIERLREVVLSEQRCKDERERARLEKARVAKVAGQVGEAAVEGEIGFTGLESKPRNTHSEAQ